MPYLVALELAGWSFRQLAHSEAIQHGARAARAAMAAVAATVGPPPLGIRLVARPLALRLGLWFSRLMMPLPLEVYLKVHFTKVHDQTIEAMAGYIAKGRSAGTDVAPLEQLLAQLPAAASSSSSRSRDIGLS